MKQKIFQWHNQRLLPVIVTALALSLPSQPTLAADDLTTEQQIQQLYLGYLGRPADMPGMTYWTDQVNQGQITLDQIRLNLVNEQPEYLENYGLLDHSDLTDLVYLNLFNRQPDQAGHDYWVNQLSTGAVLPDQLILAFINGAATADQLVLQNKLFLAQCQTDGSTTYTAEQLAALLDSVDSSMAINICPTDPPDPAFNVSNFDENSALIDNPYLPFLAGKGMIYEGLNDEGAAERVEISVSHEIRDILGVASAIVVDRAYQDGELVEETFDWYAQDKDGNVWYMGEDSKEYEDGEVVSSDGSWEAGKDVDDIGTVATAGIKMKAAPYIVGDTYLQEFYESVAEDKAEIIALDVDVIIEPVSLPGGGSESVFTTLQTLEWVPLDDDPVSTEEYKYFAPGIGLVLETDTSGSSQVALTALLDDTLPAIDPANFTSSTTIDNEFFPLAPGTTYRFETTVGEDEEFIILEVLSDTREVMGILSVVVRDRVYIDGDENTGLLIEDTFDWYAQDDAGNVWYMGEEVDNYDEDTGELLNHDGSWEAGVDGAQPGIQMKSSPRAGDSYHQEYLAGEAEDLAAVVATDVEVMLAGGDTYSTLKVKEWNPLEEDSIEYKYFAPGIGFILETKLDDNGEVEEAIEFTGLTTE
jgi:hypothetical protein